MRTIAVAVAALLGGGAQVSSEEVRTAPSSLAPLPGNGLAQHPFLYCGQGDARKPVQTLYLVRDGKIAWTHTISGKGKTYTDCALLSNGNVLYAWGHGVTEVTPEHEVVWNYET